MTINQRIALAGATFVFLAVAGCKTMTSGPSSKEAPVSRPEGVETAEDAALSKAVKEKLLSEKTINLSNVVVESRQGSVYLTGAVPSLDARERAVKIPWQVNGVKAVIDHLQVGK